MPVDLRKTDERENDAEHGEEKFAAAKKCQHAKNQPGHRIGIGFPDRPGNRRPDRQWNWRRKKAREFRQRAERFPFRRAFPECLRLRVRAALRNCSAETGPYCRPSAPTI
jgi:hypothetical protein